MEKLPNLIGSWWQPCCKIFIAVACWTAWQGTFSTTAVATHQGKKRKESANFTHLKNTGLCKYSSYQAHTIQDGIRIEFLWTNPKSHFPTIPDYFVQHPPRQKFQYFPNTIQKYIERERCGKECLVPVSAGFTGKNPKTKSTKPVSCNTTPAKESTTAPANALAITAWNQMQYIKTQLWPKSSCQDAQTRINTLTGCCMNIRCKRLFGHSNQKNWIRQE